MSNYIEVCLRATFVLLIVRMGYVKIHIDLTKMENYELDKDVGSGMMSRRTEDNKLEDLKIMHAIVHPLFQSNFSMVASVLCTET